MGKIKVGLSWPFWAFGLELPMPKSNPRVCVKLKFFLSRLKFTQIMHAESL